MGGKQASLVSVCTSAGLPGCAHVTNERNIEIPLTCVLGSDDGNIDIPSFFRSLLLR
jgi:hypothetical protein